MNNACTNTPLASINPHNGLGTRQVPALLTAAARAPGFSISGKKVQFAEPAAQTSCAALQDRFLERARRARARCSEMRRDPRRATSPCGWFRLEIPGAR